MELEESTLNRNLPAELWRNIFEEIPKKERQSIPQVNSFFYKIICDMEAFERELVVTQATLSEGIEMLLWSKRRIRKIVFANIDFNTENLTLMTKIVYVHGATVKTMSISNDKNSVERTIKYSLLIAFFEQTPTLNQLVWSVYNVKLTHWYVATVLPELMELDLTCSYNLHFGFAAMFTQETIVKLTLKCNWFYLKNFITWQPAIIHLIISCKLNDVEVFNCLKLKYLIVWHEENGQKLIKLHPELNMLWIRNDMAPLRTIEAICELEFLTHIKLSVNDQNVNENHRISSLANLTHAVFHLNLVDPSQFLQVTSIKLNNLEEILIRDQRYTVFQNVLLRG